MRGKFIVIEGGDCTGKTTQAKLLADRLSRNGSKVKMLDFPAYDTPSGKLITKYLKGDFGPLDKVSPYYATLLYSLDRYQFAEENEKALQDGYNLISNRYTQSNIGHQASKFDGKDRKDFMRWIEVVECMMPQPDDVVYLDLPVKISQMLMRKREGTKGAGLKDIHESNIEYLGRTRECYLEAAEKYNWIVINCKKRGKDEVRSPEVIHENIVTELRRRTCAQLNSFL